MPGVDRAVYETFLTELESWRGGAVGRAALRSLTPATTNILGFDLHGPAKKLAEVIARELMAKPMPPPPPPKKPRIDNIHAGKKPHNPRGGGRKRAPPIGRHDAIAAASNAPSKKKSKPSPTTITTSSPSTTTATASSSTITTTSSSTTTTTTMTLTLSSTTTTTTTTTNSSSSSSSKRHKRVDSLEGGYKRVYRDNSLPSNALKLEQAVLAYKAATNWNEKGEPVKGLRTIAAAHGVNYWTLHDEVSNKRSHVTRGGDHPALIPTWRDRS